MFKIIKDFLQSKFFKQIQQQYTIILGYVSGSKGIECSIDSSDYDVFFICKEKVTKAKRNIIDYYLKSNDGILHYTVFDIESVITKYEGRTTLIGMMSTSFNVIPFYVNPLYEEDAQKILDTFNNPLFKELSAREYSKLFNENAVKDIMANNNLLDYAKENKQLYQLALFSFASLGAKYDNPIFHNTIMELRKIDLTEQNEYNKQLINNLTKLFINGYQKTKQSYEYTTKELQLLLLKQALGGE